MIREKRLVPASNLTTFKLGGSAQVVYEPTDLASLAQLLGQLSTYYILGNGSNVVFPDLGVSREIIHLGTEFAYWSIVKEFPANLELSDKPSLQSFEDNSFAVNEIRVLAFAAMPLMRISSELTNLSFSGLEFAAGIPGTIGGAVAMNAGAHGNEISEIIECVYVMNHDGLIEKVEKARAAFSYRSTKLNGIVVAAGLKLTRGAKEEISSKRKSCLEYRKSTQPLTLPSAGSVFVNIILPDSEIIHAATLLESVGLKGEKLGGVQFSPMHSNWIVKVSEDAKTEDLINLISKAKSKVKEKYGVELTTEIKFWL